MYKFKNIRGFVALPIIIAGAVLAVGILGGLAYEYKDKLNFSGVDKNKMLAQVASVVPSITITSAPSGTVIFPQVGTLVKDITYKWENLNLNQKIEVYYNIKDSTITCRGDELVGNSCFMGFSYPTSANASSGNSLISYFFPSVTKDGVYYITAFVKDSNNQVIASATSDSFEIKRVNAIAFVSPINNGSLTLSNTSTYPITYSAKDSLQPNDVIKLYFQSSLVGSTKLVTQKTISSVSSDDSKINFDLLSYLRSYSFAICRVDNSQGILKLSITRNGIEVASNTINVGILKDPTCPAISSFSSSKSSIESSEVVDFNVSLSNVSNIKSAKIVFSCSYGISAIGGASCGNLEDSPDTVQLATNTSNSFNFTRSYFNNDISNMPMANRVGGVTVRVTLIDQYDQPGVSKDVTLLVYPKSITPITCTSFTYSDWSSCLSNSQQTRTIIGSLPSGCTGGSPQTTQACTYVPPVCASFAYSDWGACQPNNNQTRNVTSSSPSGCTGGSPVTSQSCSYVAPVVACASFTYSDWSVCQSNSTQYRSVISSSPSGCTGGSPITTQACTYSTTQATTQTQRTSTVQQTTAQAPVATQSQSVPTTQAVQQPTTSAVSSQSSTSYIQDLIAKLMEQIKSIQQQLTAQQSQPTTSSVAAPTTSGTSSATPTETISVGEDTAPAEDNQTELFSYTWDRDLYYGLTNDKDVEALQNVLVMESCYTGPVTGNFYRLTRAGVICFQKKHNFTNIPGTGYIGSYTRRVLNELYSK